jgi:hypothetical protein
MAKEKKTTEGEEVKGNIENLAALRAEYLRVKNGMPTQKANALRKKLIELFTKGIITEDEQDLMETILRRERNKNTIASKDNYLLNKIENDRLTDEAIVKSDNVPGVLHLKKDLKCRYFYDDEYNDGKGKEDSVGRFFVYVPRTIKPLHQLTEDQAYKKIEGRLEPSELPKERIVIHRIGLRHKEFERWFEPEDPEILSTTKKAFQPTESEYQF